MNAARIPAVKKIAFGQTSICCFVNVAMKTRMMRYISHFNGSKNFTVDSTDKRNVFNGEMLRIEIRGNNPKSIEMSIPNSTPFATDGQEIVVVSSIGKRSLSTVGNTC